MPLSWLDALTMIEQFHFIRPYWLFALFALAALVWRMHKNAQFSGSWSRAVDAALLPHLLAGQVQLHRRWPLVLVTLVGLIAIIALAGPSWDKLPQPVYRQQSALVIALDLSRSMDANDLKPNRLTRARLKVADILAMRREGQTALVAYAAQAFVVTPLTEDVETINSLLPSLSTDIMPAQGSRADYALLQAFALFRNSGAAQGDILLVSDGFSAAEIAAMRALLADNPGYRVSVLAVGSDGGGPVPLTSGGFLQDAQGAIVIAATPVDAMRAFSAGAGGVFEQISADDRDVRGILQYIASSRFDPEAVESEMRADIWREQGPWLVLLLLPLAALAFRRGLLWLVLIVVLPLPPVAEAAGWDQLWKNDDQRGTQLLEQGEPKSAAELFIQPRWKASSWYKAGDYDKALQVWDKMDKDSDHYNRGNALAKLGRLEQAIAAYDQALTKNPQLEDAIYNRRLVEQALRQQQQNQQPQQGEQQQPQQGDNQQQQQGQSGQREQQGQSSEDDQPAQGESGQEQSQQKEQAPQESDAQAAKSRSESKSGADDQSLPDDNNKRDAEAASSLEQQIADQAAEQWLRKIPDDPGGLLRRKFLYQYRQLEGSVDEVNPW